MGRKSTEDSGPPTAPWRWPQRLDGAASITFTAAHREAIRRSLVGWDTGESGAAMLADRDGQLHSDRDDELTTAAELFLNLATLSTLKGTLRNPFSDRTITDETIEALLDGMPDPATTTLLRSRQDSPFEASANDLALWQAAYRWRGGINPKRPFGSEQPAKDIRNIVDPKRALTNAALGKLRKTLESRLALLLLFVAQNATLEPGDYVRWEGGWLTAATLGTNPQGGANLGRGVGQPHRI